LLPIVLNLWAKNAARKNDQNGYVPLKTVMWCLGIVFSSSHIVFYYLQRFVENGKNEKATPLGVAFLETNLKKTYRMGGLRRSFLFGCISFKKVLIHFSHVAGFSFVFVNHGAKTKYFLL
jgi:hypothetical protein